MEYSDGKAFGELALYNDSPRAASIFCKADTHFAVLSKQDFNKILATTMRE